MLRIIKGRPRIAPMIVVVNIYPIIKQTSAPNNHEPLMFNSIYSGLKIYLLLAI
jgi:hypothetical protein